MILTELEGQALYQQMKLYYEQGKRMDEISETFQFTNREGDRLSMNSTQKKFARLRDLYDPDFIFTRKKPKQTKEEAPQPSKESTQNKKKAMESKSSKLDEALVTGT